MVCTLSGLGIDSPESLIQYVLCVIGYIIYYAYLSPDMPTITSCAQLRLQALHRQLWVIPTTHASATASLTGRSYCFFKLEYIHLAWGQIPQGSSFNETLLVMFAVDRDLLELLILGYSYEIVIAKPHVEVETCRNRYLLKQGRRLKCARNFVFNGCDFIKYDRILRWEYASVL